jgi:heptaprenyl diphosphate synthase
MNFMTIKDDDVVELAENVQLRLQSCRFDVNEMPGIALIEEELQNILADSKGTVQEMCHHILKAGGKRIRPLLVLYSGAVFVPPARELVLAAVAAELIHMASLVHDDIIDRSFLRRGKPSINKMWGSHHAVLCGDYLFARAFGVLSRYRLLAGMDYMVEAIENMCCGEIVQAEEKYNCNVTMNGYYERIALKTAIFLKNCCQTGASIAGAEKRQVEAMGEYGLNLGFAFQIIDDLLDFRGNVRETGKPKSEDLREGNITMPVIYLLSDKKYGDWMREVITTRNFNTEVLDRISLLLDELEITHKCFETARMHIGKAKKSLEGLPHSMELEFLEEMADLLETRVN